MQKLLNVLNEIASYARQSHMELAQQSEALEHSLNDGMMNSLDKPFLTFHNEQLVKILKQQLYALEQGQLGLEYLLRHMMPCLHHVEFKEQMKQP